jgi:ATP-dependent helicase/DNAse subunit B
VTIQLLIAPAGTGKTAHVLTRARQAARGLQSTPRVVLPSRLQVRAWRRCLAQAGGAIGVRTFTFDQLYAECLSAAGEVYTKLDDPVRYRLIRAIVDGLPLAHYASLTERPGFVQVLGRLIAELKAGRIWPEEFAAAVHELGGEPRLVEIAQVYTAYQERLQAQGWADRAGLGWLGVEALEERAPQVGHDWSLLLVDGFDDFTPVQLALLKVLAGRVGEMIITLTGAAGGDERPLAHKRFDQTRQLVEKGLDLQAELLVADSAKRAPALVHLEAALFRDRAGQVEGGEAVELREAPDRAAEVRAALRWLKKLLVERKLSLSDVALLARSITPYGPFIVQTAREFGLPVQIMDGLPLKTNPALAALLNLLRLMLPTSDDRSTAGPALPRRPVIEAWRSPYFDWSAPHKQHSGESIDISPGDADVLDAAARWGRVVGGQSQWKEMLTELSARPAMSEDEGLVRRMQAEGPELPVQVPVGAAAQALHDKFNRFVRRLTPPLGKKPYRDYVQWLERLIGPDPDAQAGRSPGREEPTSLQVVERVREGPEQAGERDVAALRALKGVLRGLVWAEEALGTPPIDYRRFLDELVGAVEATTYGLPFPAGQEKLIVADVIQARGVSFRAVAVLGLAEGEFPATLNEDPFLREADRKLLGGPSGLRLESSLESYETQYFYETVTRPRERLLLTRPRLADNGAIWQASPFWEELARLLKVRPERLTSESTPSPDRVASWPELMESLAARPDHKAVHYHVLKKRPKEWPSLKASAGLFSLRRGSRSESQYDGDLRSLAGAFAERFAPRRRWSTSRLEAYRTCPFLFFVGSVLGLEAREEPVEGLDARQLGNIYHHILEKLYQVPEAADLERLLEALEAVAAAVLDEAPMREGFRETAWWEQTRAEIVENVRRSLEALAALEGDYVPHQQEAVFGLAGRPPLVVRDGRDSFEVRGFIDRVDRAPDGRVRVIDYKTGGPFPFTNRAIAEGKKLQLPLYALAARDALGLGEPAEGFYWHVRQAVPSGFTLSGFKGGPEAALEATVEKTWEAVYGARAGYFAPHPPVEGCPRYCPAAAFCWRHRPGYGR